MYNYLQFIPLQTEIGRTYDFNGAMTTKKQQQWVGLVENKSDVLRKLGLLRGITLITNSYYVKYQRIYEPQLNRYPVLLCWLSPVPIISPAKTSSSLPFPAGFVTAATRISVDFNQITAKSSKQFRGVLFAVSLSIKGLKKLSPLTLYSLRVTYRFYSV